MWSWRSSLLFDRARYDSQVVLTQPLIDSLPPFVSQTGKDGEPAVSGRLRGEVHVLERELQRELGRELAVGDPVQFGCLPRRHQRAAAKCVITVPASRPVGEQEPPT